LNATPLELARVVNSRSRESDSEYVSQDADVEEARRMDEDDNDTRTPNHGNRDLDHNKLDRRDGTMSSMYHGNQIACIQFLYFLFVCLMDGASVRVGIWCLLYSRPWLFSLIGINAEEWGFGLEQPVKMISIHAVLLYCLFYLVANMWFAIWFLILFLAKWRLIGVYTPGLKTSRSWFVRNWIVGRIAARIPWSTVYGTPLGNSMLSMLGAKVGERAYLKIDSRAPIIGGFDCIEIGKDACINHAFVSAISMSPLGVDVGQVRVLDRAVVDPRATLVGHNTLLKDSQLGCLSNMKRGDAIPSGEYWIGSPAAHSRAVENVTPLAAGLKGKKLGYGTYHLLQSVYTFVVHLSIGIPLTFTTAVLLFLSNNWWTPLIFIFFILFHIPWATLIMIVVPALYIKSINHFNDLSAGDYHLYSWPSLLITLKQGLFAVPQGLLNNTFFLVDWMRWCGAKIGQRSEFARVQGAVPDMMAFGDETFLSNWTHVATSEILGGVLRVGGVKVGDRFLAGNRSVIPIKTKMGHNVLLGVLSLAPTDAAPTDDITWLGNPAIPLSHPKNDNYPVPKGLEAEARRIWDFIAICIPLTLLGAMSISWFLLAHVFHLKDALFPYVFHSAAAGFVVRISFSFLTAKWLYWYFENGARPSQQDYWSPFNHRWHIYSKTWATFVRPTILIDVEGSWFMNKFLTTTTDMQIGKGSYLACADAFREHDLVRIGTGSVINTFGEVSFVISCQCAPKMIRMSGTVTHMKRFTPLPI
jgi:non-ribosomal peptide synthetase-like protein